MKPSSEYCNTELRARSSDRITLQATRPSGPSHSGSCQRSLGFRRIVGLPVLCFGPQRSDCWSSRCRTNGRADSRSNSLFCTLAPSLAEFLQNYSPRAWNFSRCHAGLSPHVGPPRCRDVLGAGPRPPGARRKSADLLMTINYNSLCLDGLRLASGFRRLLDSRIKWQKHSGNRSSGSSKINEVWCWWV